MPSRSATRTICATCKYWDGQRRFYSDNKGIKKYSVVQNAAGICRSEGRFKNSKRLESRSCICYTQNEER